MTQPATSQTPWWFTALLAVLALPLCATLYFATSVPEDVRWLAWLFPAYLVLSAVCAHICYADRPALAWIIAALMALCDAGMWLLV